MAEVEYEHECSRAELLGLPKPSREEFFSRKKETSCELNVNDQEVTAEEGEEAGIRKEGFQRISGGLDELNSILSSTQKKLNRFKTVCGSFSNVLKLHLGTKKDENEAQENSTSSFTETESMGKQIESETNSPQQYTKKNENSEMDKLDSLISKAERAELSLSSQNKQMKKFLN